MSIFRANPDLGQIRDPASFQSRITDLDADIIAPALQPEGLPSVIPGKNPPRQVIHCNAERPGLGFKLQPDFVLARIEIRTDLVDPVE